MTPRAMSFDVGPPPFKVTYRQEGGDDGYCYALRVNGRLVENGLTLREVRALKRRLERSAQNAEA